MVFKFEFNLKVSHRLTGQTCIIMSAWGVKETASFELKFAITSITVREWSSNEARPLPSIWCRWQLCVTVNHSRRNVNFLLIKHTCTHTHTCAHVDCGLWRWKRMLRVDVKQIEHSAYCILQMPFYCTSDNYELYFRVMHTVSAFPITSFSHMLAIYDNF